MLVCEELSLFDVFDKSVEIGVFHNLCVGVGAVLFDDLVLGEPVEAESVLLIDHEYFLEEVDEQWGGDGLFHDCVIDDFLVHLFVLVVGNDLSEIEARPADVMYNIQQLHRRGHFLLIKGHLPKEHLKEYNAKAPYIYLIAILLITQHLRRQIIRRPQYGLRLLLIIQPNGNAEIRQLPHPLLIQYILGLQIPMQNLLTMQLTQPLHNLHPHPYRLLLRECSLLAIHLRVDLQVHLAHLHHKVDALIADPLVGDVLDDVFVAELFEELDLGGDVF